MATLLNNLAGGTNGTTLTGGAGGNTGGTSGSFFDTIGTVAGGVTAFSNTQSIDSPLALATSVGVTAGNSLAQWDTSLGTVTSDIGRAYVYLTANPGTGDAVIKYNSAGSIRAGIQFSTSRQIIIQNAASSFIHTFTATIPLNTWVRFEWSIVFSATVGNITVNYYATAESVAPTETYTSGASQNFGASANQLGFGWQGSHASQPTIYWANLGAGAAAFLGPVLVPPGPPPVIVAPGWHPGRGLPGLPDGTPFYAPPSLGTVASAVQATAALTGQGTLGAAPYMGAAAAMSGTGTLSGTPNPAPAFVQLLIADGSALAGSRSVTLTATTTVGHMVSLYGRTGTGDTITAISDSRGNAWTIDKQGSSVQTNAFLASCIVAAGKQLLTGDTITLTCSGTHANEFGAAEYSGVKVVSGAAAADQAANVHNATPTGPVTTGTAVSGGELVLTTSGGSTNTAAMSITAADASSGGTWANLGSPAAGGTGQAWQVSPAFGTLTAFTAAWSAGASNSDDTIVSYLPAWYVPSSGVTSSAAMSGSGTLGGLPYFDETGSGLSGQGTLGGSPVLTGAAAFTGQGTLAASPQFAGAAAFSGSGTLGGSPVRTAAGALSGLGTLGASPQLAASGALSGLGTLAAAPFLAGAAALSGLGTLAASGAQLAVTAALSGQGTLAATPQLSAAAALSGLGTLSAAPYLAGAAGLSGLGTLSAAETLGRLAALSGLGTLAAAPYFQAAGGLAGLGTLGGAPVLAAAAGLSGSGTLSAAPGYTGLAGLSGLGVLGSTPVFSGSQALSGLGTLTSAWTFGDLSVMSGLGTLTGTAGGGASGSAALTGLGTLNASPALSALVSLTGLGTLTGGAQLAGAAALSGLGTLAGVPSIRPVGVLSGAGTLAAAPFLTAAASLTGTGTLTAGVLLTSFAALSGSGTLSAVWVLGYQRAAGLSGLGTLTGTYQGHLTVTVSLSGVGTLTGSWTLGGAGNTGTVLWTAAPARDGWSAGPVLPRWLARLLAPRWSATPYPPRWRAGPFEQRWSVIPYSPRWRAKPAPSRWEIIMTAFAPISALSLEEINITWTSDLDGTVIVPTALTVQFAVPVSSGSLAAPAQPVTWYSATWLAGGTGKGYVAQGLVGPGAGTIVLLAGAKYDVWGKITGSPEAPVKFAGVQAVY